jgi:hypothetical protein
MQNTQMLGGDCGVSFRKTIVANGVPVVNVTNDSIGRTLSDAKLTLT